MASSPHNRLLDCEADTVDRISNLPRKIIDLILERLPLHDVARTTILSKNWRKVWATHPNLFFDDMFMSQLVSKNVGEHQLYEVSTTISKILLLHDGPILKFHLSIPRDLPLNKTITTNCWIKNLSNNGVTMLDIINNPVIAYRMPSHLFSCVELTHLRLINCILNAPINFQGFRNLISVELFRVIITADMSFGSQLEILNLENCSGIKHLGCQFENNSNLSKLKIVDCEEIIWRWSECSIRVKNFCPTNPWKNFINLDKLLGNMPKICFLCLDGYFLKCLKPGGAVLKRLITTMDNLKTLHLLNVGLYNLVQTQYVLCLIRSSPNLQNLSIILEGGVNERADTESLAPTSVEQYLQLPNLFDMNLDQLETVNICGIVGSSGDLLLIKLLLAYSPSLRWMKISNNTTINDAKEELRISRQLLMLPKVSPIVQILYI